MVNVRKVMRRRLVAVLLVVYLIIGVIVAAGHHYFAHLNAGRLVSAVLAVLLWPLVLLGLSLHLK